MKIPFILGALSTAAFCAALDGVVPPSMTSTEAGGTFFLTTTGTTGRTYQYVIDSSQLTVFTGMQLTGLAMRLNNTSGTWPPAVANYAAWDIRIGAGVDPAATSNTFASNFTGSTTLVRSGALSFSPGDFPSGASGTTPNAFGPTIVFNTPYTYTGGDLAVEMRFSQQTGATTQSPFDAVAATDTANGYGTLFAARFGAGSTATTGGTANFVVTRFTAVPEPGTIAALGLGVAALLRRRRK